MLRLARSRYIATRLLKNAVLHIPGVARLDQRRQALLTGPMNDPEYLLGILDGHLRRLRRHGGLLGGLRALELGPGNSLGQGFMLLLLGAESVTAVDVRRFATAATGRDVYSRLCERVRSGELPEGMLPAHDWLDRARALLPDGAKFPIEGGRLRYEISHGGRLPSSDASIELLYSCSVLEHVTDPKGVYAEMARVVRPGGLLSHIVDLRDHHHPDPFDFLRYEDGLWKRMQGRSAGSTNRLRASEHRGLLVDAGFEILEEETIRAPRVPERESLAPRFRDRDPEDLAILTLVYTARRG